ncbi:MAG TPA: carboxylesterase [Methylococcaceae bacterium]|nr:carboxylesterase [Methylococcaceae bacterium]HIO12808.1 carboxylesterase [Methylococcales bacterium]
MAQSLTTVNILPTAQTHQFSIIWLHGLGANGHDFEALVPELHLNNAAQTHFVFPNAPSLAVTINNGMVMPAWYDILEMSFEREVDYQGIESSSDLITQLINQEIAKGIAPKNILLAGFSQGGVIALHAGLTFKDKLGGIMALSTYLPEPERLLAGRSESNQHTPIFMAHGTVDPVVNITAAKSAFKILTSLNYPVQWHEYTMEHAVCFDEIQAISNFITHQFES